MRIEWEGERRAALIAIATRRLPDDHLRQHRLCQPGARDRFAQLPRLHRAYICSRLEAHRGEALEEDDVRGRGPGDPAQTTTGEPMCGDSSAGGYHAETSPTRCPAR